MNIFGKVRIGYLIAESNKFDQWIEFAKNSLGLCLAEQTETSLSFRIDEHQKRFIITQGSEEDITHLGLQVDHQDVLNEILSRFKLRGIQYQQGTPQEAALRGVEAFWSIVGPKGLHIDLFIDAIRTETPLSSKVSGFYTDTCGMGHIALTSQKPEKMIRFWQEFFDARLTDTIEQKINGIPLNIRFLRMNERHHSIAVASTGGLRLDPIRNRVQHINFEVLELNDVTLSYQRCKDRGFPIIWDMGQHTNDKEISFYVKSPSDFEVELGWNPIKIDERTWQGEKHISISIWGHRPNSLSKIKLLSQNTTQFSRGLYSLLNKEQSPI